MINQIIQKFKIKKNRSEDCSIQRKFGTILRLSRAILRFSKSIDWLEYIPFRLKQIQKWSNSLKIMPNKMSKILYK